ncbi:hypothetical protein [Hamadaea tsunoensis]|uniref:hypothetical protein n=1 Tax=Hamadaea tsunoensis TaxID=53368 RepID=UPI0004097C4C|nr:hypothetical protein [Hamadaea tsunoensis]
MTVDLIHARLVFLHLRLRDQLLVPGLIVVVLGSPASLFAPVATVYARRAAFA